MSKSYHATRKDLRNKTRREIDELAKDSDSVLRELVEKRLTKKEVKKQRRRKKKTGYNNA